MKWVCGAFGVLLLMCLAVGQAQQVKPQLPVVLPPLPPGGPFKPPLPVEQPKAPPRRPTDLIAPSGPPKYDLHGDQLPPGAIARFGSVRLRHGAAPMALAFSPDGKVLGSISNTNDGIRLWDPKSGKEVARFNSGVTLAAFARDGSVVVIDESRCRHWVPSSNLVRDLPEKTIPEDVTPLGLAVHPNLRVFALGVSRKVLLIDLQTGKVQQELKCPDEPGPTRLVFSPDGRWLAGTAADQGIWLWDLRTFKRVRTYHSDSSYPELSFSHDGSRLAVAGERLQVHGTDSEEVLETYKAPEGQYHSPRFTLDGKSIVAVSPGGEVVEVNAVTGEAKEPIEPPDATLHPPVSVSAATGLAAAVDSSGGIRIWDPKTGKGPEASQLPTLTGPNFSADGKIVRAFAVDNRIHVCDAATGKLQKTIEIPDKDNSVAHWDPITRRVVFVSDEGDKLEIYDGDTARKIGAVPIPENSGFPTPVLCSGDKDRIALFLQGSVQVYNLANRKPARTLNFGNVENSLPSRGAISPDGRLVAVADGTFSVWEVITGKKRFEFNALPGALGAAFSPNGRFVAAWDPDANLMIFDIRFGTAIRRLRQGEQGIEQFPVVFSPDSSRLAIGTQEGLITVWDIATGDSIVSFARHDGAVTGLGWSPDGTKLASTATDGTLLVWELPVRDAGKPGEAPAGYEDAFRLLGSPDPAAAQRGMAVLYRHPLETPKQCLERISIPAPADKARIAKLIQALDDEEFAVRSQAVKDLDAIGGEAVPQLRAVVEQSPSAEVRKLAADLLVRIEVAPPKADVLRAMRAIEVLETIATPEAQGVLSKWATGPTGHRITLEANAAITRLKTAKK